MELDSGWEEGENVPQSKQYTWLRKWLPLKEKLLKSILSISIQINNKQVEDHSY